MTRRSPAKGERAKLAFAGLPSSRLGAMRRPASSRCRGHGIRFAGILLASLVATVLLDASPAAADPPGPTDYQTEVVSIDPPADIRMGVIGGDSFLEMTVVAPVDVVVLGYEGEPYLRFDADGSVYENLRSPARYLNEDRYGAREIPSDASADAEPEWERVDGDAHYAWHDHRAHWMNPSRPVGREPGDQILEAVVPIEVDGRPVAVTVQSTWLPAPSAWPAVLGGLVGAALVAMGLALTGGRYVGVPLALTAAAALVMGWLAYSSVPPEAGASLLLWALPATALVIAVAGAVMLARGPSFMGAALMAAGGLELALWAWTRWDALVRAIVPSDAPDGLDRAVITAALVVGLGSLAIGARQLFQSSRPAVPTGPTR